ncbi:hypothetical protein CROQUDRAFT_659824 [Cronartium quercuum f. sp. fusiforme G11]|uniref:Uncharacterized protein n=1 Tax=Cronartium quercuum f. sp. fusiforme G11 TaxID=708437 RepID=A0A9P6NJA7_9BASI|nr:hypothetical protein CROQUDRAFT_659824 [Cronartium quercuum f. sp. fusiforme G11]
MPYVNPITSLHPVTMSGCIVVNSIKVHTMYHEAFAHVIYGDVNEWHGLSLIIISMDPTKNPLQMGHAYFAMGDFVSDFSKNLLFTHYCCLIPFPDQDLKVSELSCKTVLTGMGVIHDITKADIEGSCLKNLTIIVDHLAFDPCLPGYTDSSVAYC